MDNITPLQELARIAERPRRRRPAAASASARSTKNSRKLPAVALFQPRETIRYRSSTAPLLERRSRIPGPGRAVRSVLRDRARRRHQARSARRRRRRAAHVERRAAEERRRAGAGDARAVLAAAAAARPASAPKPACSASRGTCATPVRGRRRTPNGGPGGPMVPPGKYSVRLTSGGQTITRTFELQVGSARRRRRRDRRGDRRAGEVPAAGARRDQRRAEAAAVASSRRCRRPA